MSSRCWGSMFPAASDGSFSQGSRRPGPPGSKIPDASASIIRRSASPGLSGCAAELMTFSTSSSIACNIRSYIGYQHYNDWSGYLWGRKCTVHDMTSHNLIPFWSNTPNILSYSWPFHSFNIYNHPYEKTKFQNCNFIFHVISLNHKYIKYTRFDLVATNSSLSMKHTKSKLWKLHSCNLLYCLPSQLWNNCSFLLRHI